MKDPASALRVMLWVTTTEQDCPGYLEKMADMKGYRAEKPADRPIGNNDGWIIDTAGDIYGQPSYVMLAGVSKPGSYPEENALYIVQIWCPKENALYIVQIWCPKEKSETLKPQMLELLAGVKVMPGG
jgi:hypothetical protein